MAPIRRSANVVWEGMTGWTKRRPQPDLLLVVPGRQGGSLGRWLETAAVVADVTADSVMVPAEANRPFRLAQLTALVREWMHAHTVDSVLMSCDGALFSLCPHPEHATQRS